MCELRDNHTMQTFGEVNSRKYYTVEAHYRLTWTTMNRACDRTRDRARHRTSDRASD